MQNSEIRNLLAPAGKLRVGVYPGSPLSMVRNPTSGEMRGVTYEVGRELAQRLEVAFEPVVFARVAEVVQAVRNGTVDITFTNATPERAQYIDFTLPLLLVEQGYLIVDGSPISTISDVERAGVRVGVLQGSTSQVILTKQLKNAEIVPLLTLKGATQMLTRHEIDVFATNKAILFELCDDLPSARILDGRYGVEKIAMGIPKRRDRGLPYLREFAETAKSTGLVSRVAQNAGLRGMAEA